MSCLVGVEVGVFVDEVEAAAQIGGADTGMCAVFFTPFAVDFCKVRLHGSFGFREQKVKPIDVDVQTIGVNAIFGYVTE